MQTVLEVGSLKPLGTKVLVKRQPALEKHKGFHIPEEYRDRNELQGQLYTGVAIAVGDQTKSARFGRSRGWFEPGDPIWFWARWDWADKEVVLKDSVSGDEYLMIDEDEIKAYELPEGD